jgi:hypothetical protein
VKNRGDQGRKAGDRAEHAASLLAIFGKNPASGRILWKHFFSSCVISMALEMRKLRQLAAASLADILSQSG